MSSRERILILVMLALAVAVAITLVARARDDGGTGDDKGDAPHLSATARAARMTAEIRAIEARPVRPPDAPLARFVERAAHAAGFTAATVEPGPKLVRLAIPAVSPRRFFPWLDTFVRRHGLVVERLAATPNVDRTLGVAVTLRVSTRSVPQ